MEQRNGGDAPICFILFEMGLQDSREGNPWLATPQMISRRQCYGIRLLLLTFMSKRVSTSSTSPNKRRRPDANQASLESFFSSPGRAKPRVGPSSPTKDGQTARTGAVASPTPSRVPEIIDVDLLDSDPEVSDVVSLSTPQGPDLVERPASSLTEPNTTGRVIGLCSTASQMNSPPYEQLTRDVASFVPDVSLFVGVAGSRPVGFTFLAHTLAEIRKTRSRTAILNALTNFMRIILIHHPQSLVAAVYLLSNTLSPPYTQVELGLGPSAISQSIQQVSGLTSAALRKLYNKFGDPGDVAFEAKSNMRTLLPHAPLSICDVHSALLKIAACKGQGAAKQKQKLVEKLLVATRGEESRFLVRILSQNLRVGAVRTSILTALARAMVLNGSPTFTVSSDQMRMEWYASPSLLHQIETGDTSAQEELRNKFKRADSILRRVFATHPDYDHVISALMDSGFATLHETVPLTVG